MAVEMQNGEFGVDVGDNVDDALLFSILGVCTLLLLPLRQTK